MVVLNCEQMRLLEKEQENCGTALSTLMLNAGEALSQALLEEFKPQKGEGIAILCGKGNNGGDGFVAAKRLKEQGFGVVILLVDGEPASELAKKMLEEAALLVPVWRYHEEPVKVREKIMQADYIIDAVYGFGFKGELNKELCAIADYVKKSGKKLLSCDIPSGVECDSGFVGTSAFYADATVTFTAYKPAHVLFPGMDYCGKIIVKNVGISRELFAKSPYLMRITDSAAATGIFPEDRISDNKGSNGTLLAVCGSFGMAGAAVMSIKAALYSGTGLVRAVLPQSIYPIVAGNLFEPVFLPVPSNSEGTLTKDSIPFILSQSKKASAVLIGCGMGLNEDTAALLYALIKECEKPMVIDADGINALSAHIDILKEAKAPIILTPHPGEMARLLNTDIKTVQINRRQAAKRLSDTYRVITVLKGANTIIALPDDDVYVNTTGNNGMAKGGSGDVLAGIIASFAARGVPLFKAALAGVYFHGVAGDIAKIRFGKISMQPTDIIDTLPQLFRELN